MLRNYSSLATFLSLTVKAHVHSVTHGQLRMPQHTYTSSVLSAKRTLSSIGLLRTVIGVGRNPERVVVVITIMSTLFLKLAMPLSILKRHRVGYLPQPGESISLKANDANSPFSVLFPPSRFNFPFAIYPSQNPARGPRGARCKLPSGPRAEPRQQTFSRIYGSQNAPRRSIF